MATSSESLTVVAHGYGDDCESWEEHINTREVALAHNGLVSKFGRVVAQIWLIVAQVADLRERSRLVRVVALAHDGSSSG